MYLRKNKNLFNELDAILLEHLSEDALPGYFKTTTITQDRKTPGGSPGVLEKDGMNPCDFINEVFRKETDNNFPVKVCNLVHEYNDTSNAFVFLPKLGVFALKEASVEESGQVRMHLAGLD